MKAFVHRDTRGVRTHDLAHRSLLRVFPLPDDFQRNVTIGQDPLDFVVHCGHDTSDILVLEKTTGLGYRLVRSNSHNRTCTNLLERHTIPLLHQNAVLITAISLPQFWAQGSDAGALVSQG